MQFSRKISEKREIWKKKIKMEREEAIYVRLDQGQGEQHSLTIF